MSLIEDPLRPSGGQLLFNTGGPGAGKQTADYRSCMEDGKDQSFSG